MPIRFSTQAANADKLHADYDIETPQAKATRKTADRGRTPIEAETAEQNSHNVAKPGKDINAAGFIKDRDPPKP